MKFRQPVIIAGYGKTGEAVAEFLISRRKNFGIYDDDPSKEKRITSRIKKSTFYRGFLSMESGHVVLSPGFPLSHPGLKKATRVESEIEFIAPFLPRGRKIFGVTGTDGKSTAASLMGHLLGKKAVVVGNFGIPLSSLLYPLNRRTPPYWILELSSFQLERIPSKRILSGALLLNLRHDHRDRYRSLHDYHKAKASVFKWLRPGGRAVLRAEELGKISGTMPETLRGIRPVVLGRDYQFKNSKLTKITESGGVVAGTSIDLSGFPLEGVYRETAALSVLLVSRELTARTIEKRLSNFKGLPHRLERVGERRGVSFYNDSKATTPSSVAAAIETLSPQYSRTHVLIGGQDKKISLSTLKRTIRLYRPQIYFFGKDGVYYRKKLQGGRGSSFAGLGPALKQAARTAKRGEVILLSPCGVSFDEFENFEARGRFFKHFYRNLPK